MMTSTEGEEDKQHVGVTRLVSMGALVLYSVMGAGLFMAIEGPEQETRWARRQLTYVAHKHAMLDMIIGCAPIFLHVILTGIINTTELDVFLLPISVNESNATGGGELMNRFDVLLDEFRLDVTRLHRCEHELRWDFANSMLYCWTVVTTIGYGHLYPMTNAGKIGTMLYSLVGIPMMLMILTDLGRLLTRLMKLPWFVTKLVVRRASRWCTRRSIADIQTAEASDRMNLEVFDLPVPVAIGLVVLWIFVCSAIQMIWEHEWNYLVAFYFFFISLTTIGLGDIVPTQPHYLLLTFGNILIGLSLLSMVINLIHSRIEQGYANARQRRATKRRKNNRRRSVESGGSGSNSKMVSFFDKPRVHLLDPVDAPSGDDRSTDSVGSVTAADPSSILDALRGLTNVATATAQQRQMEDEGIPHNSHEAYMTKLLARIDDQQRQLNELQERRDAATEETDMSLKTSSRTAMRLDESFYDNHHLLYGSSISQSHYSLRAAVAIRAASNVNHALPSLRAASNEKNAPPSRPPADPVHPPAKEVLI